MNKKCFAIMPFKEPYNAIWGNFLTPLIRSKGLLPFRGDSIMHPGSIMQDVLDSISQSEYILAETTEANPNVYYELGYAHALKKEVILLTQNAKLIPFDIHHLRAIEYSNDAAGLIKLQNELAGYFLTGRFD